MIFAAAAVVAALTAGVGTFLMRAIARKFNIADHPSERRINTTPVPRAGGLAVAATFSLIGAALVASPQTRVECWEWRSTTDK